MKQREKLTIIILALVFTLESPRLIMQESKVYTAEETEKQVKSKTIQASRRESRPNHVRLDVPLENQFEGEALANGCEVTALAMLLRYHGIDTTKNKLADGLDYVPLLTASGKFGNPHEGFVGNIYAGNGTMGVAVEPIAKLAQETVGDQHRVISGAQGNFTELLQVVATGTPIWLVTTIDFTIPTPEDFRPWEMDTGTITISPLIHAAVITGFEGQEMVYLNDPSGIKDRPIARKQLEEIFNRMGGQFLYLSSVKQA